MKYLVSIALIFRFFPSFHNIYLKIEFALFWDISSSLVSLFISNVGLSTSSSGYCSTPSGSGSKQEHIQSSQDCSVSHASDLQSVGYIRDDHQRNVEQQIRRRITLGKTQHHSSRLITDNCD